MKYIVGFAAGALTATVLGHGLFTRRREEPPGTLPPSQTTVTHPLTTVTPPLTTLQKTSEPTPTYTYTPSSVPIPVPDTSACAITSPPPSMEGINTHPEVYGTGPDLNMITLGPKLGIPPEKTGYPSHHGMVFELKHGTPLLAPIDMVLVGFQNDNTYQIQDGQKVPFNNLQLFFESASPDWPGMIIYIYHTYSSPLLLGHNQNPDCGECEDRGGNIQAQGHLFMTYTDYVCDKGNAGACKALIGYAVKRGQLFGFAGSVPKPAGSVGTHSFADFCFKVAHTTENPTVQKGNRYLHWVQPSTFFYWKSYSPDANFPNGVLAYPFECDGYQLPPEQHDVNFKYKSTK